MPWSYISRDALKTRLGDTLTTDDAIYRDILEAASVAIDDHCRRSFRVHLATRYLTPVSGSLVRLDQPLLSVTTLKTDEDGNRVYEVTWATTDYDLLPLNALADGRPYTEIAVTPEGDYGFPRGLSKSVELVGKWGFVEDLLTLSATLAEVLDASETGMDVSDGTAFDALQTILIDSEQMYVTAIATNTLTVERAVNGTTAATHSSGATVKAYRYPRPVVEATVLHAVRLFRRKDAPFGVTGGADLSFPRNVPELDPDVKRLLAPYVRMVESFA